MKRIADKILLSASSDAVDATLISKDHAVLRFATEFEVPLSDMAAIGDSINDLPFLKIPGIGLIGAPANAQKGVKEFLQLAKNSYISRESFLAGFVDFYKKSHENRKKFIFSDRDGVLIGNDNIPAKTDFSSLTQTMGLNDNPFIIVLTGSSFDQNIEFIDSFFDRDKIRWNQKIANYPYLIHAENGALQINILDKSIRKMDEFIDIDLLKELKDDFFEAVKKSIEDNVLKPFELHFTLDQHDQISKIYIPNKISMVTFNIPTAHGKLANYRNSSESETLRTAILTEMIDSAEALRLPYEVLK